MDRDEQGLFLELILDGDRRGAERCARRVLEQHGVTILYEEMVQPALERVGNLWYSNRISVADEHLATATAQSAVAALYPEFSWPEPGPHAVIACVQGERHEFGARMVADLLALDGWDERFFGSDMPIDDLVAKVRQLAPRLVALSVTIATHLAPARQTIALIRAAYPPVKILVGGQATVHQQGTADALGADAAARRGSEAVEVARGWK